MTVKKIYIIVSIIILTILLFFFVNTNVWYCNNCNAIWYEYYQESGGNIPKGKPDASPNSKIPLLSSLDNTSSDES